MTFELNGMEELNEQELMMVEGGGRKWWKHPYVPVIAGAIIAVAFGIPVIITAA